MSTPATAASLAQALQSVGVRAQAFKPDDDIKVESVNVWREKFDRYPWTTVYGPSNSGEPGDETWEWGPSFEFHAPADLPAIDLAERVIATLKGTKS